MEAAFNAKISGKGKQKCNTAKFLWPKPFKLVKNIMMPGREVQDSPRQATILLNHQE